MLARGTRERYHSRVDGNDLRTDLNKRSLGVGDIEENIELAIVLTLQHIEPNEATAIPCMRGETPQIAIRRTALDIMIQHEACGSTEDQTARARLIFLLKCGLEAAYAPRPPKVYMVEVD